MSRALRLLSVLLLASLAGHAQAEPGAKTVHALGSGLAIQRPLKQVQHVADRLRAAGQKPVWNENGGVEMHGGGQHYYETWYHDVHGSLGYITAIDDKKSVEHTVTMALDDRGHMQGASSVKSLIRQKTDTHHVLLERVGADGHVVRSARIYAGDTSGRMLGRQRQGADGAFEEERLASAPLDQRGGDGHNELIENLHYATPTQGEAPRDVALGTESPAGRTTLDQFGATVGASIYRAWGTRGLATHGSPAIAEFAEHFHEAMKTAIARGGRIKYDLTGIDVARAKATLGDAVPHKGITAWELRQVLSHPAYLAKTDFYLRGEDGAYQKLSAKQLRALGIE